MKHFVLNPTATDNNNNNGSPKTISTLNTTKVSTMNTNMVRRWGSSFLLLGIVFSALAVNSQALEAREDVIPVRPTLKCADEALVGECTNGFPGREEQQTVTIWTDYPQGIPDKRFKCDVHVRFAIRQCKDNRSMHQYDIHSIALDLSYKVGIFPVGFVYPCRDAMRMFRGNPYDVTEAFNEFFENVYKQLVIKYYTDGYKTPTLPGQERPILAPCDNADPNDPNQRHPITVVATNASCAGKCVTFNSFGGKPIYDAKGLAGVVENNTDAEIIRGEDKIVQLPDGEYGFEAGEIRMNVDGKEVSLLDPNYVRVEPIDDKDIAELNDFIATEINPFIEGDEYKLPLVVVPFDARMLITNIPCTEDFCCVNKFTVCFDKNGNIHLTQNITGDTPTECRTYTPIWPEACPESTKQPITYPCTSTCK